MKWKKIHFLKMKTVELNVIHNWNFFIWHYELAWTQQQPYK